MSGSHLFISNPALWLGATALLLPPVVHLLTRRLQRTMWFPSLRFLKVAKSNQSQLFRLRHLLLLLIRMLAIAALLFAFLLPLLSRVVGKEKGGVAQGDQAAVVLLDASASMQYEQAGLRLYDQSKQVGRDIIKSLPANALLNFIQAGGVPRMTYTECSANRHPVLQEMNALEPGWNSCAVDRSMTEVIRQLAQSQAARKTVYVLSDFQRNNWASYDLQSIPAEVEVVLHPVRADVYENMSIRECRLQPSSPALGEAVELLCKVAWQGVAARDATVRLILEDGEEQEVRMIFQPGENSHCRFKVVPEKMGWYAGRVVVETSDGLMQDNTRYFSFHVASRVRVSVLTAPSGRQQAGGVKLLATALDPFQDAADSSVQVKQLDAAISLPMLSPDHDHVVWMQGSRHLKKAEIRQLLEYMHRGGSVVVALTSEADAANVRAFEAESEGRLTVVLYPKEVRSGKPVKLALADLAHPVFAQFSEHDDLMNVAVSRYFATRKLQSSRGVLAQYDNGVMAMSEQPVGAGRLVVCNMSSDLQYSDLARRLIYVPFVHEVIKAYRPQADSTLDVVLGQSFSISVEGVTTPDEVEGLNAVGKSVEVSFRVEEDHAVVTFPPVDFPGHYRVLAGGRPVGVAAVNLDARESDLEMLSDTAIGEWSQRDAVVLSDARPATLRELQQGKPIWAIGLVALGILFMLEQLLWIYWKN